MRLVGVRQLGVVLALSLLGFGLMPAWAATTGVPTGVPTGAIKPEATADAFRLVLGSFSQSENADRWADKVAAQLPVAVTVLPYQHQGQPWFRVATVAVDSTQLAQLQAQVNQLGWVNWVLTQPPVKAPIAVDGPISAPPIRDAFISNTPITKPSSKTVPSSLAAPAGYAEPTITDEFDLDLGLQSRTFARIGAADQTQWQVSASASWRWHRSWRDGQRSFTAAPFVRVDSQDSERTHVDLREFFTSTIGDDWELHLGVRRVFWGVTEFHHLVDIVNQTDLVENIDTEDKLGQPMVHLSLVRDWGILDFLLLPGFRERTFPGDDGRLRLLLPINTDRPTFESSAGNKRTDVAVRWSHSWAGVDFGLYHFSGTNRDPLLVPVAEGSGGVELRPFYSVIDQTGLDAQANWRDWAFKIEAITRSGDGERYAAANIGFERTLVGAFGTRSDLGLVVEYLFDERGESATNTLFEQDLAVGARWQLNDLADTQALFGIIWDTKTDELLFSVEANRRIGDNWQLVLEGRAFSGASDPRGRSALALLLDEQQKSAALQRDDYVQLELTRYF